MVSQGQRTKTMSGSESMGSMIDPKTGWLRKECAWLAENYEGSEKVVRRMSEREHFCNRDLSERSNRPQQLES